MKIKRGLHVAAIVVYAAIAIGALVLAVIVQFQNPAMTQTQLLLKNWPLYLAIFVCAIVAQVLEGAL